MTGQALLLSALLAGCGSESFAPDGVDLSGTWLLSSETSLNASPPGSGITSNGCSMKDVPVTLEVTTTPTLWVGRTADGGTLQCELNGVLGTVTPYNPGLFLQVTKAVGALTVSLPNGVVVYTGELVAANRMSGSVTGDLDGRIGTWTGLRQ